MQNNLKTPPGIRNRPVADAVGAAMFRSRQPAHAYWRRAATAVILLWFAGTLGSAGNLQAQTMSPRREPKSSWPHLKYAIYFCNGEIERLLVDPAARRETMDYFAPVRPQHVYLECSSSNAVDVDLIRKVADALRAEGLKVSGAIVPAQAGIGPFCYNNPQHMAVLEGRARAMAKVFDEIIVDDWLFTTCTCDKCVAGRGRASWSEYRPRLIQEQVKTHLLGAAKEVNPKVRIIIKYPNWYESHLANGYDVFNETRQFDAMAVGIETRTRATHDQHIPIYSGYVYQKWWGGVDPQKWIGSWLDNYGMKGQDNDFVAQVWQAVLAQAPEIILWSGGNLHHSGPFSDVYPHFRDRLPEFDRVAGLLKGSGRGVPIYLPYGSTGEYSLFGHFGMAGIPLEPVGQFPADSQVAIFTCHSLKDPQLADKMLARIKGGRDVFMTYELYRKLADTDFKNMLSIISEGGTVTSSSFRVPWNRTIQSGRPFTFPRIATATWPAVRQIAIEREDYDYGVFFDAKYLDGHLYVLNVPDNSYDLIRLPEQVLNPVRDAFARELGVTLHGPGGVGFYPFGEKQYVLYNMSDTAATMTLVFDKKAEVSTNGWKELVRGEMLRVADVASNPWAGTPARIGMSLTIQPFDIALVQAP
jgi:hypothetical protein